MQKDGKWGVIDRNGDAVVPPQWDDVRYFSEGLAQVEKAGKYGFIDRTGKEVAPPQWDLAGEFSEGLAQVKKAGQIWLY